MNVTSSSSLISFNSKWFLFKTRLNQTFLLRFVCRSSSKIQTLSLVFSHRCLERSARTTDVSARLGVKPAGGHTQTLRRSLESGSFQVPAGFQLGSSLEFRPNELMKSRVKHQVSYALLSIIHLLSIFTFFTASCFRCFTDNSSVQSVYSRRPMDRR